MPFVLREEGPGPAVVIEIEPRFPKVIANCGSRLAVDFQALFRNAWVARRKIEDLSPRAVGKKNLNVKVIISVVASAFYRPGLDFCG
jgi:hypothetical protein